jgi:hypothetical protein
MQRLGNSLRAAEYLGHAINVLKEDGKADASAVDVLLWRVMGNCWPLPSEPEFSPIDTNLSRMESPPAAVHGPLQHDVAPIHSGLVRNPTEALVVMFPCVNVRPVT